MLYELRIYHMFPEKMDAIHKRFSDHTISLFEKHGMKVVDFWEDAEEANKIYYVVEHKDMDARNASFDAFRCDEEWNKVKTDSELTGPIVEKIETYFMKRVPYSPVNKP